MQSPDSELELCPISDVHPNALSDTYRGLVTGTVPAKYAGFTLQAYEVVAGVATATPSTTIVAGDGSFSLDLSTTPGGDTRALALDLVNNRPGGITGSPRRPLNSTAPSMTGILGPLDSSPGGHHHGGPRLRPAGCSRARRVHLQLPWLGTPAYRADARCLAAYAPPRYMLLEYPADQSEDRAGTVQTAPS